MELNLLPTIQQAISGLLLTYEPEFLRFGHRLFLSFATIIIAWHGIHMMFSRDGLGDSMFEFAKLLLVAADELLEREALESAVLQVGRARLVDAESAGHRVALDNFFLLAKKIGEKTHSLVRFLQPAGVADRAAGGRRPAAARRRALEVGCILSIDSDAHKTGEFEHLRWGISQARRAWVEPQHVLNTRSRPNSRSTTCSDATFVST